LGLDTEAFAEPKLKDGEGGCVCANEAHKFNISDNGPLAKSRKYNQTDCTVGLGANKNQ